MCRNFKDKIRLLKMMGFNVVFNSRFEYYNVSFETNKCIYSVHVQRNELMGKYIVENIVKDILIRIKENE